jgi:PKD repeat protein
MRIRYPSRPRPALAGAAAGVLAVLLLAGCTAGGGDANVSPHADLNVNHEEGWTGEEFIFDASESADPDGEITSWRVDFGDGTPPQEVRDEDMADEIRHTYARGGEFTVKLLVIDDGDEGTGGASDDDSTNVAVNEKVPVASTAISAVPGNDTGSRQEVPFTVYDHANRYDLNLTFSSLLPTGSSEFEVRVVDPDNQTVGEPETVTVDAAEDKTVDVDGLLTQKGAYRIVIEAKSGGGTAAGELRIYYGEDVPR